MAFKSISTPTLIINNKIISFVPGSLEYKRGHGETIQRVGTTGGGQVEFYLSEDVTTKIGTVKFKLYNTQLNNDLIDEWKLDSRTANIAVTINDGDFNRDYTEMVMTNDPDMATGPDSEIDIEMSGRGLV